MRHWRRSCCCVAALLAVWTSNSIVSASDTGPNDAAASPLHVRIDELIEAAHFGSVGDVSNDNEFLRRIYLNLAGRTPTADELAEFENSHDPEKRVATIDRLLESEEFSDHFAAVLDVMFMERRGGSRIPQADWRVFLRNAIADRWPLDRIVRTIIAEDGRGPYRAAAKFMLERDVEANAMTRDIGRIFLGRDLQCAQCHDHPNIVDYEQSEYYGLFSFVNRSYLFEDAADKKKPYVAEKAEGEAEFKSVFYPDDDALKSRPHLLDGLDLDVEPRFDGGDPYIVAPTKTAAGMPKFSRRSQLARLITHPQNLYFAKNVANRLWALMMGRGLVEPIDFHHDDNPPTHPAVLKLLADELVDMKFDLRGILRQLALSKTYQRSIDFPAQLPNSIAEVDSRVASLESQLVDDTSISDQQTPFMQRLELRRKLLADIDLEISDMAKGLAESEKQVGELTKASVERQKHLASNTEQLNALKAALAAAEKASKAFSGDKALADAAAQYRKRLEIVTKGVEATKQEKEKADKELQQVRAKVDGQRIELARRKGDRIGVADMVAEARGAVGVFRQRARQRQTQRSEIKRQLRSLATVREYLEKRNQQSRLADQIARLQDEQAEMPTAKADAQAAVARLEQRVQAHQDAIAQLEQRHAAAATELDIKAMALESLVNAIASAESAASSLGESELNGALTQLRDRQQRLVAEIDMQKKSLAQNASELESARAQQRDLNDQKAGSIEELRKLTRLIDERATRLKKVKADHQALNVEADLSLQRLRDSWVRHFAVRAIVPLSSEQLAGSTIAALQLMPRFRAEAESEWTKKNMDKQPDQIDQNQKAAEVEKLLRKRVDGVQAVYVSMFAAPGGSPQDVFSATADQALFLANDGRVQNWLSASDGTLMKRLQSVGDASAFADQAYRSLLARNATDEEKQYVQQYLQSRPNDRNKAIQELIWGLVSSLEFRFNH